VRGKRETLDEAAPRGTIPIVHIGHLYRFLCEQNEAPHRPF
jgi:hypothetical protein